MYTQFHNNEIDFINYILESGPESLYDEIGTSSYKNCFHIKNLQNIDLFTIDST